MTEENFKKTRIAKDSLGEVEINAGSLYGAQTQRAVNNFPISGKKMPASFINSLIIIKSNAAKTNIELDCLEADVGEAIIKACQTLRDDKYFMRHFPVDVFQTGSGTSSNMNANEVIASLASEVLGKAINPNDHVNFGQSSNDVIPTAIHVSAVLQVLENLIPALQHLIDVIENKALDVKSYCKTGRTHLMDAMPIRLDQSLLGWSDQLTQNIGLIEKVLETLKKLALGGTAVGTGINTHEQFAARFADNLSAATGVKFSSVNNFFPLMGSQDSAVALSGQLKTLAVTIMKVSNDLRWMNSGPLSGLGEITLQPLQPGSSIMPGKVNPVIPEATAMIAAEVIGNDSAITIAGQSGNFELNVMLPLIACNLLSSINLLSNGIRLLADKAIKDFTVNESNLRKALRNNPILVTALNPIIGYTKAAEIAKKAYQQNRPIIDVAVEETDITLEELTKILDPIKLTKGGL
tara:strand:+ start:2128 stop:3522 length:1395 start_codon:yes stop_codon:yes gene_type:complete